MAAVGRRDDAVVGDSQRGTTTRYERGRRRRQLLR